MITTSLEGCTHRLADVGNRVHTRNDSDEDVRGNAYKLTNSLEGFTLVFHYSNILSSANTNESFTWTPTLVVFVVQVVFVVHVVFVVLKTTTYFCLACNKENNKYDLYNLNNFKSLPY